MYHESYNDNKLYALPPTDVGWPYICYHGNGFYTEIRYDIRVYYCGDCDEPYVPPSCWEYA